MKKMTDAELAAHVMNMAEGSEAYNNTIQNERQTALDYYNQELYGDEQEGWSKYVSSEVRDTIEWILPQLMEIFAGDEVVEFSPKGPEDVAQAALETAYINHVFNEKNPGFLILQTWLRDALLQKNGIVKAFWDKKVNKEREEYEDLTEEEYLLIVQDDDVEIVEHTVKSEGEEVEGVEVPGSVKHDVVCYRKSTVAQARIINIPPERFFIQKNWTSLSLKDCPFCGHIETVTESDLLVDGYDEALVKSIPSGDEVKFNDEEFNRYKDEGGFARNDEQKGASREITVRECYTRVDFDGDGEDELRMVKIAGGTVVLENVEISNVPLYAITPLLKPHSFFGISIADLVADLQKLKSVLMRQTLNNLYLTNHPVGILVDGTVKMTDVQARKPGSHIRATRADALTYQTTPFVARESFGMMEYIDRQREERSGVSSTTQGLDPGALSDSTNLVGGMIMTAAQRRVMMIARNIAETGFKELMLGLHGLCQQYAREDMLYSGGNYQAVKPREWKKRNGMRVKVGIGHSARAEKLNTTLAIIANQEKVFAAQGNLEGPLLNAGNVYNALTDLTKISGRMDVDRYFMNPTTYNPAPKSDPVSEAVQIEQGRLAVDAQHKAAQLEFDKEKHKDDQAIKLREIQLAYDKMAHEDAKAGKQMQNG